MIDRRPPFTNIKGVTNFYFKISFFFDSPAQALAKFLLGLDAAARHVVPAFVSPIFIAGRLPDD